MKKIILSLAVFITVAAYAQNVGIGTNDPKAKLDINGSLSLREGPVLTLANGGASGGVNDNIALPDISSGVKASFYRIAGPNAAFSVYGIQPGAGANGLVVTLVNTTANVMTLKNEASSVPVNGFKTLSGGDMVSVAGNSSVTLQYNKTDSRWYVTGSQNYTVSTATIATGNITTSNTAITLTNNTGRLVGTPAMTIDVATNALNTKGLVPGPTGSNGNMVWGTDNTGNPAWQKIGNSTLTNSSITVTPGAGVSVSGSPVALGGTVTITNTGDTNAGDDITTATTAGGDLTGTYPNPVIGTDKVTSAKIADGTIATIDLGNSQVTYGKMQNVGATRLLGNPTGTAAAPSEISLGTGLSFSGTTLNATGGTVTGVTASNGLNSTGGTTPDIKLGGTLSSATTITENNSADNLNINNTDATNANNNGNFLINRAKSAGLGGTMVLRNASSPVNGNASAIAFELDNTSSFDNAGGMQSNAEIRAMVTGGTAGGASLLFSTYSNTAPLERMRIQHDGNVGIGVTNPAQKLSIAAGNAQFDVGYGPYWSANTDEGFIRFRSTGNAAGLSYLEIGTTDDNDEPIVFTQSGNERMRIHTNAFIGIGTAAPTVMLDVNGAARVRSLGAGYVKSDASGNLSNGAIAAADIPTGSGNYIQNQYSAAQTAEFYVSGRGRLQKSLYVSQDNTTGGGIVLADDGDIVDNNTGFADHRFSYGIRVMNGNGAAGTVVAAQISSTTANPTYFNAGNVGIGITAPATRLEIGAPSTNIAALVVHTTGGQCWGNTLTVATDGATGDNPRINFSYRNKAKQWQIGGYAADTRFSIWEDGGDGVYGSGWGNERVTIQPGGTLEALSGLKTERHIRFYKRSRGNNQGGTDVLGNYDFCYLAGAAFRNSDSVSDEDDDYQCNVYTLDINGSADYGENTNQDYSANFGSSSRPSWRLYSECYQDCSNVTCTSMCINFDF